jgi:hypothetical protein
MIPRAPTLAQQTGWQRPHPHMLCQGFDKALEITLAVTQFDFDLDCPAFRFYAEQRGVLWLAGNPGSDFWQACRDAGRTGRLPAEADSRLRVACGRLQDAAEIYRTEQIMVPWVPPAGVPKMRIPSGP